MRECHGLVDALVTYINHALDVGKCEDKVRDGQHLGGSETVVHAEHLPPWPSAERGECCVCAEKPVLPPV